MTLSAALSNALSGLAASTRTADVVSANLANVLTEGFAPREIALSSTRDSGGVRVVGVSRQVDAGLLADQRIAESARAAGEVTAAFSQALERVIGTPDVPASLSARFASFEAALVTASTRPEDNNRLQAVLREAQALGGRINAAADEIGDLRSEADRNIATGVDTINSSLRRVVDFNARISANLSRGADTSALEDQRQQVIDNLAEIVPVRQVARENGAVALVTTSGGLLLDGRAVTLSFDPAPLVAPNMMIESGALSGIRLDGVDIPVGADRGPLQGGRLGAFFDIRDRAAVEVNAQLDAVARDLIERFQQDAVDSTRGPDDPGIFTDAGIRFDPVNTLGVASRLSVNRAIDPQQGGEVFRIRDGLGALSPGLSGEGGLIADLGRALTRKSSLPGSILGTGARTIAGHAATLISSISQDRVAAEQELSFTTAQAVEFRTLELATGVDSDAELQRLLLVEQAFGANARMVQAIDEMLDAILRI
ncbi:flagellar hook-associated protein FlgK [uncultured Roseovarius sp.]|uniref:flagellar hook-associated protein FlgK n=1 Tax=uncultured Roseovarius sp. TaxID=293344 RepID=UPI00261F30A2|nr:flagellar hook-associated protein FlgK [uncultured Roseovarius sp.]